MASELDAPLLLDTAVLTWLTDRRNRHPEWDELVRGRTLVLSFASVGEILHGALRGGWSAARVRDLESRLEAYVVIPGTIGVARMYARLRQRLFDQVGENDLRIAACALSQQPPLEIATPDTDFDTIAAAFPALALVRPPSLRN